MSIATLETYDKERWQTAAARVRQRPEVRLFIDGDYVDAVDGGRFPAVYRHLATPCSHHAPRLGHGALLRHGYIDILPSTCSRLRLARLSLVAHLPVLLFELRPVTG